MSKHSVNYELSDTRRKRQLRRFTRVSDPEDLRSELGAARLLAAEAIEAGQTALASRLLETVVRCAQGQVATQRAKGELLHREVVLKIGMSLCNLLGTVLDRQSLPASQRGAILDEVAAGVDAIFEEIEPKRITDERSAT